LADGREEKTWPVALYEQDFFLWTKEQAAALRLAKNSNLPLDWENLAEEIERKSDRRELRSQIRRILRHLLKLEATPSVEPRAGWRSTVLDARTEITDVLRDSPSLRREVDDLIAEQLIVAAELASIRRHRERIRFAPRARSS